MKSEKIFTIHLTIRWCKQRDHRGSNSQLKPCTRQRVGQSEERIHEVTTAELGIQAEQTEGAVEMTEMDEQNEEDFEEWLRRGRKSFELELIDDDHPGGYMRDGER